TDQNDRGIVARAAGAVNEPACGSLLELFFDALQRGLGLGAALLAGADLGSAVDGGVLEAAARVLDVLVAARPGADGGARAMLRRADALLIDVLALRRGAE